MARYGLPAQVLSDIQAECCPGIPGWPAGGVRIVGAGAYPSSLLTDRSVHVLDSLPVGHEAGGSNAEDVNRPINNSVTDIVGSLLVNVRHATSSTSPLVGPPMTREDTCRSSPWASTSPVELLIKARWLTSPEISSGVVESSGRPQRISNPCGKCSQTTLKSPW